MNFKFGICPYKRNKKIMLNQKWLPWLLCDLITK